MLQLEFMRLALAVGVVVGILAPAVGFFLVAAALVFRVQEPATQPHAKEGELREPAVA